MKFYVHKEDGSVVEYRAQVNPSEAWNNNIRVYLEDDTLKEWGMNVIGLTIYKDGDYEISNLPTDKELRDIVNKMITPKVIQKMMKMNLEYFLVNKKGRVK